MGGLRERMQSKRPSIHAGFDRAHDVSLDRFCPQHATMRDLETSLANPLHHLPFDIPATHDQDGTQLTQK
jgi:hypothetical protein